MERRRDVKTFKEKRERGGGGRRKRERRDEKIFKQKRLRGMEEERGRGEEMRRHLKRRD